ncbi:MAG: adenosine deaminase [Pseudomonadota bacterium]
MTFSPKIELHLHIEGAAPPAFIRGLAKEKHIDLSGIFRPDGSYDTGDFERFLKVYEAAASVLTRPEDYGRLTTAILDGLSSRGVIYAEVFTAPQIAAKNDLALWRDHVAAIAEAAEAVPGIELRQIPTCVRHFGPEAARGAALCAAETAGAHVTGWGMGGNEAVLNPKDFAWAFDCAREAGLGLTCHAGEFGGPDSVRDALDHLKVSRIGHGVRAIEDLALVDRLAEDGIVLEVNPGSNVALSIYENIERHPIETLRDRGVKVTVSTDDPPFFHTDMDAEYAALHRAFGWDDETFRQINRNAAEAAFCDDDTRAALLKQLD